MPTCLITWSDRGVVSGGRGHHGPRPTHDPGPVVRLLRQKESKDRYDAAWVLTTPAGEEPARSLCAEMQARVGRVELRLLEVDDPSDHAQLFQALGPWVEDLNRAHPAATWQRDIVLSAGTPQAQTLWVILVQSGILEARMLQVIPPAFVPRPHPRAIREVSLDIEGFPVIQALRDEVERLRATVRLREGTMVGESEAMRNLAARIARVAASEVPVLVLGETGSGKELVARAIHDSSQRHLGPFVAENCGAFTEGLLASELFGHEAGAFTGATGKRRGLFEQAHGGTLFLDEIGEMEPRVQSHLLRVLQEGTIRRVGGERSVGVDVRVVAATHRPLYQLVQAKVFREDLYYRLRGATLEVPAIRQRTEDVPLLVHHFLQQTAKRRISVSARAMAALIRYRWPGNVRELRAEVVRWSVFCGPRIDRDDLAPEILGISPDAGRIPIDHPAGEARPLAELVSETERVAIQETLEKLEGNLSLTARTLQIDRNTLKRKMAAYGIVKPSSEA